VLHSTSLPPSGTQARGPSAGVLREGEVRYSWTDQSLSTTPAYELTKFTFTGQYSYMDDPSTTSVTEGFGLMFYNARWYDPALGRFPLRFASGTMSLKRIRSSRVQGIRRRGIGMRMQITIRSGTMIRAGITYV